MNDHIQRIMIGTGITGLVVFLLVIKPLAVALSFLAVAYFIGWFFHALWNDARHNCDEDPACDEWFCKL